MHIVLGDNCDSTSRGESGGGSKLSIKRIHLLSACSLLSAEFGSVLEGF